MTDGDGWVTLATAADLTELSYNYLQGRVAAGRLRAYHPDGGRMVRIRVSDLETFMVGPPPDVRHTPPKVIVHPRVGARQRAKRRSMPAMTVGTP
jgi:excisionase family DNA binding protein